MSPQKYPLKNKQLRDLLVKELNFMKSVFSVITLPSQMKGDNDDNPEYEIVTDTPQNGAVKELPKRARSIAELEEKLEKIKLQRKFNLKNKLVKKSLSSKLNKKIKKKERQNNTKVKPVIDNNVTLETRSEKPNKNNTAKPVFNDDGKLVFSKFDFSNIGHKEKRQKGVKDPKKILEVLKHQEQKLSENQDETRVKEIKEKMAWKNMLQKAEGQKIKDDPILLKKSIKKMEQKKKHSKQKWDSRKSNVAQKKEDRQKKRKENITKKKKEKKSKIIKTAMKRGRVVI